MSSWVAFRGFSTTFEQRLKWRAYHITLPLLSCTMAEYLASIYGTEKDKYVFAYDDSLSLLLIDMSCLQSQLLLLFQGKDTSIYMTIEVGSTHGIVCFD